MDRQKIHQGDSTLLIPVRPFLKDAAEVLGGDWVCKTAVLDATGTVVIAEHTVTTKTDDNLYFLVGLTSLQTTDLTVLRNPTVYQWVIQLSNATLNYSKEKHIPLFVMTQGITS